MKQVLNEIKNNTKELQLCVATLNHTRKARKFYYDQDLYCVVVLKASCWDRRTVLEPNNLWGTTEYPMVQIWRLVEGEGWEIHDNNSYDWLPSSRWERTILQDNGFEGYSFCWA